MSNTHYFSLASATKGLTEPEEIEVFTVESCEKCGLKGCIRSGEHAHTTISWDGGDYSRDSAWISADEHDIIDLSTMR